MTDQNKMEKNYDMKNTVWYFGEWLIMWQRTFVLYNQIVLEKVMTTNKEYRESWEGFGCVYSFV